MLKIYSSLPLHQSTVQGETFILKKANNDELNKGSEKPWRQVSLTGHTVTVLLLHDLDFMMG